MRHGEALSIFSHPDIDLNIDFIVELSGKKGKWYLIISFWQSDHDKIVQVGRFGQWELIFSQSESWSPWVKVQAVLILRLSVLACRQEPCHVLLRPFRRACSFLVFSRPSVRSLVFSDWTLKDLFYINHLSLKYWWLRHQQINVDRRV